MKGLKEKESPRFERFFRLVQQTAAKEHSVFFVFAGEGKNFEASDMECENLSGWLIPIDKADAFEIQWKWNNSLSALQDWTDFFVWAVWSIDNEMLAIRFEKI